MTPAVSILKKAKIKFQLHEYTHDPDADSYGDEAAEKLDIDKNRVFKTLVVSNDNHQLFVAVLPVSHQLNFKLFAKASGSKKIAMADKNRVEKVTGYVLGGVSPVGQKKNLPAFIDETANNFQTIFVSAGRRGLQIEIAPADLADLTGSRFSNICQP